MQRIAGLALATLMVLGFAVPAAASENSKHDRENPMLFATGLAPTAAPGGNRVLLAIDMERGTTTVIGSAPGSLAPNSLALAITPDGTAAYTIANSFSPAHAQLAKIDLATGAQSLVGSPIGSDLKIMGMTFSPDGVLYAAGDFAFGPPVSSTFNSLYTIDLRTGAPTRVGSLGAGPNATDYIMSFVFDSRGNMYGASPTALYKIHLPDAEGGKARKQEAGQGAQALATHRVGFIGSSAVMGIAIGEDGNFYAADFVPASKIYGLDVKSGVLTPLFNTGIANVHNIAFNPEGQRGHHE